MRQQGGRTDLTSSHGETKLGTGEVVAKMNEEKITYRHACELIK